MQRYVFGRLIQSLVLVVMVSLVMFTIIFFAPGGPAILLSEDLSAEAAAQLAQQLGLDRPFHEQYGQWMWRLLHGDLGTSFSYSRPVAELIPERLNATAWLAVSALLVAVGVALPLGIVSAVKRYSAFDYLATALAFFGVSVPVFWFGIMLIILFSVILGWLPSGGMYSVGQDFSLGDRLRHLILPTVVLSTASMAQLARYTRSSMLSVLGEDYVRTARSKGIRERRVLLRHALRNALVPVITVIGVILPRLFSGAAITESVFAWPGLGRMAVDAAFQRDYPVIMALTLFISAIVIAASLVVDLLYMVVDPRIRYD